MNIRKLQQGLRYRGKVEAPRQTYHVFAASDYFFVLSFALARTKRGSGYFNVVDGTTVDYVTRHFAGRSGVTAKDIVAAARRSNKVPNNLVALNVLYILVALGQASITRVGERRQLFFAIRRSAITQARLAA